MIDWSRVDELRAEVGPEEVGEIVALFLEEADEAVARLHRPLAPHEVETVLHFLKGSALNLGLRTLAQLCDQGERAPAAANLPAVIECYRRSRDQFLAGLAGRTAA